MRRRINRLQTRGVQSSITFTKSEPYALSFYLYNLFSDKNNRNIIDRFEIAIKCFLYCADNLNKTQRLTHVLQKEVERLEKNSFLIPLEEPQNVHLFYEDFDIPYEFIQDKKIDRVIRRFESDNQNIVNLYRVLYANPKPIFSSLINTVIFRDDNDYKITETLTLTKKLEKEIFDISRTQFLVDQVKLTENEARYLLLKCRFETIDDLLDIQNNIVRGETNLIDCLPHILRISKSEIQKMLRTDQKLKSYGFIDENGDYNVSLNDCIAEQTIEIYFNDLLKPLECEQAYELDTFSIKEDTCDVCLDLLNGNNPLSILFYGKPGSGKTELAKSLCKNTGKKVFIFKNEMESENRYNLLGRLVCLLSMERTDSVLVVDEADSLLKTIEQSLFFRGPSKNKGTINKMLENNQNKVIFIINYQDQIDDSTLRRFTFSVKFENMPSSMLRTIAEKKLETVDISNEGRSELIKLLEKYNLTGSSVDNLRKVLEGMDLQNEEKMLRKSNILLRENSILLNGEAKIRRNSVKEYDLQVLNSSINPQKIIEMVQNAVHFSEKNKGTDNSIRMLFYGLSGTGKTELARYIGEKIGRQILLKRVSDIYGMYVGQSEKNIRNAFLEAENTNSILLFDEADSFFSDRLQARTSWERTMVNEFLTQMEEFSGILICTTNLRNIMDPALQRRFHLLVEFKPMKYDGIKIMAERYFSAYHLSKKQLEELEETESVTPGDFGSLSNRIRFMNCNEITSDYIFEELKTIQIEKKKKLKNEEGTSEKSIGFA